MGAAILDLSSWGPPSWTGSDVKNAKPAPILLSGYALFVKVIKYLRAKIHYLVADEKDKCQLRLTLLPLKESCMNFFRKKTNFLNHLLK